MTFKNTIFAAVLAAVLWLPVPARAYTVKTAFSGGCHELITGRAFQDFLLEVPLIGLELPSDETWQRIAHFTLGFSQVDTSPLNDEQRFLFVSLLAGARAPDTDGHSIMNLKALRSLHSDPRPKGQYAHALRGPEDDYAEGDAAAVSGTRDEITDLVETALEYWHKPPDEQIISGRFYLDFYGEVKVDVWAPMYYLGRAVHAMQDTFSHTIRSDEDGLRKIVHVLNFIDAITDQFDEERDGLAHSDSMDKCRAQGTQDAVNAAVEATIDLFYAARAEFTGADPDAVELVLDAWVTLKPGCTLADDFCGNRRWIVEVRKKQTKPFVEGVFGCSVDPGPRRRPHPIAVLVFLILAGFVFFTRRSRRKRPSLMVVFLAGPAAVCIFGCSIPNNRGVTDQTGELRRVANIITDSLEFPTGSLEEGTLTGEDLGGPRLESVYGPSEVRTNMDCTWRLAVAPADAQRVQRVSIQWEYADQHVTIPVTIDPATGHGEISAVFRPAENLAGRRHDGLFILHDAEGRTGPGLPMRLVVIPDEMEPEPDMLGIATHEGSVFGADFAREGADTLLTTGGEDATIGIWHVATGHLVRRLYGHSAPVLAAEATRDGSRIITGGQDFTVRVWDIDTGDLLHTFGDHLDYVPAIAITSDSTMMASGSRDGTVRIRNLTDFTTVRTLDTGLRVNAVSFSPDRSMLAAACGALPHPGRLIVWNTADWTERFAHDFDREATAVHISYSNDRVAVGVGRGEIYVWDAATGQLLHAMLDGPEDTIPRLGFWPSNEDYLGVITLTGYTTIWNINDESIFVDGRSHLWLTTAAFSQDGAYLMFGDNRGLALVSPTQDLSGL